MRSHAVPRLVLALAALVAATACQGIVDYLGQPGIREIGPEGGAISVEALTIEVPEGALGETTVLVAEVAEESWVPEDHIGAAYRLGPPGTTFDGPVLLSITLSEEEALALDNFPDGVYISTVKGATWIPLLTTTVDPETYTVSAIVHHFSLYGLWMKPSGICKMEECGNRIDDDCDGTTDDDCYDPERCGGLIDEDGICADCEPDCEGAECGGDGCGGECGECLDAQVCANKLCLGLDDLEEATDD